MNNKQLLITYDSFLKEAREVLIEKNHDYAHDDNDAFANFNGSSFVGIEPELAVLVRLLDKVKRIECFIRNGKLDVKGEKVKDSVIDIINYAVIVGCMIRERDEEQVLFSSDISYGPTQCVIHGRKDD